MSKERNSDADDRTDTLGDMHRFRRRANTPVQVGATPAAQIVVLTGPRLGERYVVGDETTIGREMDDGIDVDDAGASRRHAQLKRSETGGYILRDLDSRNGTMLNGAPITETPIAFGDRITVGVGTVLLFARHGRVEDQLFQVQKLQALGELASGIAHDFNNLLGTILTNVTYLSRYGEPDEKKRDACLEDIESAARRGVGLTSQLLGFARRGKSEAEVIDVCDLVNEATQLLRRTLNRSVEVVTRLDADTAVVGDPSRLFQIVMNLSINAGDAMPEGGTLTIAVRRHDIEEDGDITELPPGHYVEISVEDTGAGMTPSTLDRVFEPFFTTKPVGRGTGLGLAMVHNIAREHGGAVTVASEPGKGSRFSVVLPWISYEEASKDEVVPVAQATTIEGRTILFADDEPEIRRTMQRLLERSGIRVLPACDGVEALQVFAEEEGTIDLVVLDLDMPGMDGAQVNRVLHNLSPGVNVLISSGYIAPGQEDDLRAEGVRGFLPKPYDVETLLSTLSKVFTEITVDPTRTSV